MSCLFGILLAQHSERVVEGGRFGREGVLDPQDAQGFQIAGTFDTITRIDHMVSPTQFAK